MFWKQLNQNTALVEMTSEHGCGVVPVPEYLDFQVRMQEGQDTEWADIWHGRGIQGGKFFDEDLVLLEQNKKAFSSDKVGGTGNKQLRVTVVDPKQALQGRLGGFFYARLDQYAKTLTQPSVVTLRLNGVGYRASVEDMQLEAGPKGEVGDSRLFSEWMRRRMYLITQDPVRSYLAREFPESQWGQLVAMRRRWQRHDVNLHFRHVHDFSCPLLNKQPTKHANTVSDDVKDIPVPKKIVMKLGFVNAIEVPVPPTVRATCPTPTSIHLEGIHTKELYDLASELRRYRPPEPYKGKGIFINDETIKIKEKRVK